MKSTYSISEDIRELEIESEEKFAQGFSIIDTKYNNGVWFTAYGKNIGQPDTVDHVTAWRGRSTFADFQEQVEELKADDYELTDVEVTPGGYWLGIFNKGFGQLESEFISARTGSDFDRQVKALQAQDSTSIGYRVADIEYTGELWIGVLDRNGSDAAYSTSESYREFTQEVEAQREDGLELTNLEYTDGLWTAVFTDDLTGSSAYSPEPHDTIRDFQSEISSYRSQGYDLINIESIDGDWFGIYKEDIYSDDPITSSSNTSRDTVSILRSAGAETEALATGLGIIADSM